MLTAVPMKAKQANQTRRAGQGRKIAETRFVVASKPAQNRATLAQDAKSGAGPVPNTPLPNFRPKSGRVSGLSPRTAKTGARTPCCGCLVRGLVCRLWQDSR